MAEFPKDIEFIERGQGPAVLLVPGSFGTGAGWKAVMDKLGDKYRLITTSLLGYGATAERRPMGNSTMQQQTDVIDIILDRIATPAHVVAHSFGGLAALAHAIDGRLQAASLTLIEANPLGILSTAGEPELYDMFGAMTEVYFPEFEAGTADAARHVIDFYGGTGSYDAFPSKAQEYIKATTPTNIRDWSSGTAFAPSLSDYRNIKPSTLVIRGGDGHIAMMRIAEILADTICGARLETIDGGSHFLPATHPTELAELIEHHICHVLSQ